MSIHECWKFTTYWGRLRGERARLGLSQVVFADACGVNRSTLATWEKGEQSPTAAVLAMMAGEGVDVQFLLTGKRSSPDFMPEEVLTLIQAYEGSSEDGRRALQMVALLAIKQSPTNAGEPGNTVNIGGDVGQAIAGDQTVAAPVTFNVGGKRKQASGE